MGGTENSGIDLCRAVESALAESEERFRQMAEMTGEWLWEQDPDGYYIYSSVAVEQILGVSQDQVLGKCYTEFLTDQYKAYQQDLLGVNRPFYGLINHLRHKDGHLVYTESTGLPITDQNGKLLKWRGVDRDITAKKHFEDALIESDKRTRLIIESALSAIIIMDSYGVITDWNYQAEKMFGWAPEAAIGQPLSSLIIPPRFRDDFVRGLKRFLHLGICPMLNKQVEHVAIRRDGREFPVEISVAPLKLGHSYIFSGFINDISARKAAERQILESQVALAIAQNEINIAQQIQASLLPSEPISSAEFEVTGLCLPANRVGGDYFDYFYRGNGQLDLVIADVSGHSVGPALFMVEARSAIRAQASQPGTPAETLKWLNYSLFEDLNKSDYFITLFYLQFDIKKRCATFANAGHPHPLLFETKTQQCRRLVAEGLILGVNNHEIFTEQSVFLSPGDLILCYTDGISEAENTAGEFFGEHRVSDILSRQAAKKPQEIVAALVQGVKAFSGRHSFNDDITLLLLKCL